MKPLTIGSLFSGIAGLERGLELAGHGPVKYQVEINDFCLRVLERHYPDTKRFTDVRKVGKKNLGKVGVLCGGFPCFVAGTLIDTDAGPVPIESVQVGDRVVTHRGRYRRVKATMQRSGARVWRVRAFGAPPIETTEEHPFYARLESRVWNNDKRHYDKVFGAPCWVPARELTKRHYVAQTMSTTPIQKRSWESPEFWYLVGRWLGDGWIVDCKRKSSVAHGRGSRKNSRVHKMIICCAVSEAKDLAARIKAAGFHATPALERTVVKFHVSSVQHVEFLRQFGRGAANKKVPAFVFDAPKKQLAAFLGGWLDADGCENCDGTVTGSTVSRALVIGMARVARRVTGRSPSLHQQRTRPTALIEGRKVNQKPLYQIHLSSFNRQPLPSDDGLFWVPIKSVERTSRKAKVFNIEVGQDNSYVADSIVVHNCQDVSSAGKRKGLRGKRSGLWREFRRIVRETKPKYVVVENVASGAKKWLCKVRSDLHALGYRTRALGISAADVGAPHLRKRIFVVAYPERLAVRIERRWRRGARQGAEAALARIDGREGSLAYADGRVGDSRVRNGSIEELSGRDGSDGGSQHDHRLLLATQAILEARAEDRELSHEERMAHAYCARLALGRLEPARQERKTSQRGRRDPREGISVAVLGGSPPRLPFGLDRWPARPGEPQKAWEPPRVAFGVEEREAKLTALGNAVLPACAYVVGMIIREMEEA